jgi:hypothetical protein
VAVSILLGENIFAKEILVLIKFILLAESLGYTCEFIGEGNVFAIVGDLT